MQIFEPGRHRSNSLLDCGLMALPVLTTAALILCPAGPARAADAGGSTPPGAGASANSAAGPVTGPSDPVLNLLLEKGMITEDEAEKTQAQADAMRTNMAAQYMAENSKWKISKAIKDIGLYGDVRLRFEDREEQTPSLDGTRGNIDLYRFRYALRFGLRGDAVDDFYYGFRLETSTNPRSTWVTMGTSSPDPYGKSASGVDVGQLYIGWQPTSWFDFAAGKMPNPLYTSSMVWSPSINPEGLAEHLKYTVGNLDLFGNLAQFLYADMNPLTATPNLGFGTFGQSQDNIFQLAWQGGFNYHITTNMNLKVGATIYQYFGLQNSSAKDPSGTSPFFGDTYIGESPYAGASAIYSSPFATSYFGGSGYSPGSTFNFSSTSGGQTTYYSSFGYPLNQVGLDHLRVLEIPAEFNIKLYNTLNLKVFGDFAYNLDGRSRAEAAAQGYNTYITFVQGNLPKLSPQTSDVKAYQIGMAIGNKDSLGLVNGSTSRKNAWELRSYWQHVEQYSLDPNLLDLDFNAGAENLQGIYVAFAYGFSDNVTAGIRYGHASRINGLLGTGGTGTDIPYINPIQSFDLLQVDLSFLF